MQNIRRASIAGGTTALMLFAGLGIATADDDGPGGNCAGHDDPANVKVDINGPGPFLRTVDGVAVTLTISNEGRTVTFTDADGELIDVAYCLKASDANGGPASGSSARSTSRTTGVSSPR